MAKHYALMAGNRPVRRYQTGIAVSPCFCRYSLADAVRGSHAASKAARRADAPSKRRAYHRGSRRDGLGDILAAGYRV